MSSFNSQKKSKKSDEEERIDNNSSEEEVQEESSDDDLERDEFAAVPGMGQGLTPEAAIIPAVKDEKYVEK